MTYEEAMALTPDDKLVITKTDFPANYRDEQGQYCPHTSVGHLARIYGERPEIWASEYALEKWDGCLQKIHITTTSLITGEEVLFNWPISLLRKLGDDRRSSLNPLKRDW
jgi:hypothetical protein